MKKWKKRILAMALLAGISICQQEVYAAEPAPGELILKYDRPANQQEMPANFRTMQSPFKNLADYPVQPTRQGLDQMKLSGSSYFSVNEFQEMIKKIPSAKVLVLDLRAESHGYLNENGISWYSAYKSANKGLEKAQIEQVEHALLADTEQKNTEIAVLNSDKSIASTNAVFVEKARTEKEFLDAQKIAYYRLPVLDYDAPANERVDEFLDFYRKLPSDVWIHAHCEAGEGRTTMFLSMIDMIHNAKMLTYDEIMTRQVLLGGQDLRISTSKDPVKKAGYLRRALFTKHFYEYVQANPDLKKSWSEWAAEQGYK